ncbi:MAG: YdiU family protein [Peptostreptococcaceae bacterium]
MSRKNIESGWNFDNSYTKLPNVFFKKIDLNPVSSPKLIILNYSLAKSLGLNDDYLKSSEGVDVLSGNKIPEGGASIAQAYGGHQFGHFTMLGDGRALMIGEQISKNGDRFDIQLKGSGKTPYSRGGDGRAVLGPMLREYIISEAMHGLGIPTTRSLSVVRTGEGVMRENLKPGAIMTRVASSHLRFGTFQYASAWATKADLKEVVDYAIKRHFSYVENDENKYTSLLKEVIKVQANLIAKWQLVGFIHGVMNTDNMTISSETIDYGPCAFMDIYNENTVFSSIDRDGRYAYKNQPYIGQWNITRFAEALLPLLHENEDESINLAKEAISEFMTIYYDSWLDGMRSKVGIFNKEVQDKALVEDLLRMMQKYNSDYTNTFIALTFDKFDKGEMFNSSEFEYWKNTWKERLKRQSESYNHSQELMKKSNPGVIPRNHRVEEALSKAERGDYSGVKKLLKVLENPYSHCKEQEEYYKPPKSSKYPYRTYCGT